MNETFAHGCEIHNSSLQINWNHWICIFLIDCLRIRPLGHITAISTAVMDFKLATCRGWLGSWCFFKARLWGLVCYSQTPVLWPSLSVVTPWRHGVVISVWATPAVSRAFRRPGRAHGQGHWTWSLSSAGVKVRNLNLDSKAWAAWIHICHGWRHCPPAGLPNLNRQTMSAKSLSADHLAADSGYLLGLSGIEMKEGHESRSRSSLAVSLSDEIPKTACQWAPGGVLILVLTDGRLPV
jgi:hypothetical protein